MLKHFGFIAVLYLLLSVSGCITGDTVLIIDKDLSTDLNSLDDVNLNVPLEGQVLTYDDNGNWINADANALDVNGDNLGNHTATENLKMSGFDINDVGNIHSDENGTFDENVNAKHFCFFNNSCISSFDGMTNTDTNMGTAGRYDFDTNTFPNNENFSGNVNVDKNVNIKKKINFYDEYLFIKNENGLGYSGVYLVEPDEGYFGITADESWSDYIDLEFNISADSSALYTTIGTLNIQAGEEIIFKTETTFEENIVTEKDWNAYNVNIRTQLNFDNIGWFEFYNLSSNRIYSLEPYDGNLFAGLGGGSANETTGDIYTYNGTTWSLTLDTADGAIKSFAIYDGNLFAGTWGNNGKIYTYNGTTWNLSYTLSSANTSTFALEVYDGKLYAGTSDGGKIYVYNGTTWSVSYDSPASSIESLGVYDGKLYAGSDTRKLYEYNGTTWSESYDFVTGKAQTLATYDTNLFAGMGVSGDVHTFDGTNWSVSYEHSGSGDIEELKTYDGKLYAVGQLGQFRSYDGTTWTMDLDSAETYSYSLGIYNAWLWGGTYSGSVYVINTVTNKPTYINCPDFNNMSFTDPTGTYLLKDLAETGSDKNASDVNVLHISGSTYQTAQDWLNITQSAGEISGGSITDNGDGSVAVSAGTGFIKTTDSNIGVTYFFNYDANANVELTDGNVNYLYIDYNSGNPYIAVTLTRTSINGHTQFTIGRVWRNGIAVHIINSGTNIFDIAHREHERLIAVRGFERATGGEITETGTINIVSTAGTFYLGLNPINTTAQDTSGAETFTAWYRDGASNWTQRTAQTQIDDTNYDNGSGTLQELTANRYGVYWVYVHYDSDLHVVYGQGDYKLAEAEVAVIPSNLPEAVHEFGTLASKIIIQKDDTSFTSIVSAYKTLFPVNTVTLDCTLITGGTDGDYCVDATAGDVNAVDVNILDANAHFDATEVEGALGEAADDIQTIGRGIDLNYTWKQPVQSRSIADPPGSPESYDPPRWIVGTDPDWFLDYDYRMEIEIDHAHVDNSWYNLLYLYIDDPTSEIFQYTQSAIGKDIVLTDSSQNVLPFDLLYFSSTSDKNLCVMNNKMEGGIDPDSNTTLYLYYGHSSPINYEDELGTYDLNYLAVYHMDLAGTDSGYYGNNIPIVQNFTYEDYNRFGTQLEGDGIFNAYDMANLSIWESAWNEGQIMVEPGKLVDSNRTHCAILSTDNNSDRQTQIAEGGSSNGSLLYIRDGNITARWWSISATGQRWYGDHITTTVNANANNYACMTFNCTITSDSNYACSHGTYSFFVNGNLIDSKEGHSSMWSHGGDGGIFYTGTNSKNFDDGTFTGAYYDGNLMEVHVLQTGIDQNWYNNWYNNHSTFSPMVTIKTHETPGGATGAWAEHENELAHFNGAWIFEEPMVGWAVYIIDEKAPYWWDGTRWVSLVAGPPHDDLPGVKPEACADDDDGCWHMVYSDWWNATHLANDTNKGLLYAGGTSDLLEVKSNMITDADATLPIQASIKDGIFSISTTLDSVWGSITTESASSVNIGEVGTITDVNSDEKVYYFENDYNVPIIVLNPMSQRNESGSTGDSANVRITDYNCCSMTIKIQEDDYGNADGVHEDENVSFIVMEEGDHTLADGTQIEAWQRIITETYWSTGDSGYVSIDFNMTHLTKPVVLSQVTTDNDANFVTTTHLGSIDKYGFNLAMETAKNGTGDHSDENVSWIVWSDGYGTNEDLIFDAGLTSNSIEGRDDGCFSTLHQLGLVPKVFIASQHTRDGGNGGWAIYCSNDNNNTNDIIYMHIEETETGERNHATEEVGYLLFNQDGNITISAVGKSITPDGISSLYVETLGGLEATLSEDPYTLTLDASEVIGTNVWNSGFLDDNNKLVADWNLGDKTATIRDMNIENRLCFTAYTGTFCIDSNSTDMKFQDPTGIYTLNSLSQDNFISDYWYQLTTDAGTLAPSGQQAWSLLGGTGISISAPPDITITNTGVTASIAGYGMDVNSETGDINYSIDESEMNAWKQNEIGADCASGYVVKGVDDDGTLDCVLDNTGTGATYDRDTAVFSEEYYRYMSDGVQFIDIGNVIIKPTTGDKLGFMPARDGNFSALSIMVENITGTGVWVLECGITINGIPNDMNVNFDSSDSFPDTNRTLPALGTYPFSSGDIIGVQCSDAGIVLSPLNESTNMIANVEMTYD